MSDRVSAEELRKYLEGLNDEDLGKVQNVKDGCRRQLSAISHQPSAKPSQRRLPGYDQISALMLSLNT